MILKEEKKFAEKKKYLKIYKKLKSFQLIPLHLQNIFHILFFQNILNFLFYFEK